MRNPIRLSCVLRSKHVGSDHVKIVFGFLLVLMALSACADDTAMKPLDIDATIEALADKKFNTRVSLEATIEARVDSELKKRGYATNSGSSQSGASNEDRRSLENTATVTLSAPKVIQTTKPAQNAQSPQTGGDYTVYGEQDIFSIEVPPNWSTIVDTDLLGQYYPDLSELGMTLYLQSENVASASNLIVLVDFQHLYSDNGPLDLAEYVNRQAVNLKSGGVLGNIEARDIFVNDPEGVRGIQINYDMNSTPVVANFLIGHPDDLTMLCGRVVVMIQGVIAETEDSQIIQRALESFSITPNFAGLAHEKGIVSCNDMQPANSAEVVNITASNLLIEFNENAVSASAKYMDFNLTVRGMVNDIGFDWDNRPFVSLGSEDMLEYTTVRCLLSDTSQVSYLKPGTYITVEGSFKGWQDGLYVLLNPCSVKD